MYELKRTPNGVEINETKKSWFGRKRKKKVTETNFFSFSKDELERTGSYAIVPHIEKGAIKYSILQYLEDKAKFNLKNNLSDFNFRTIWKFKINKEETNSTNGVELKTTIGELNCYDEKGRPVLSPLTMEFTMPITDKGGVPSSRTIELLIQNACNGKYQTARDIEEYEYSFMHDMGDTIGRNLYYCEECGEEFKNLNEFFYHLIDQEHFDSILTSHKYDKEVLRVKELIERKKSKE